MFSPMSKGFNTVSVEMPYINGTQKFGPAASSNTIQQTVSNLHKTYQEYNTAKGEAE